ncbi:MAG: YCF48-related protein [Sinimarinibacterium sp.]|jgi:photosystem II stability/assembly factor-like uncharacterized protein
MKAMTTRFGAMALVLCAAVSTAPDIALADEAAASGADATAAERAHKASRALLTAIVRAGNRLVAVGSRGHILTSDDGATWTQAEVPVNVLLTAVSFADARNGWAVGHDATVLHTQDGGTSWQLQNFQPGENALLDVLIVDAQRGLAVGAYGLMLQTVDGGASWTRAEGGLVEEGLHFNALTRLNDGSLFLVGEQGMMARSTDDGASWQRLQSPYESSLFAVASKGDKGAVVGGLRGNAFQTADVAGGAWARIDNDSVQSIFGISALPDDSFAFAGLNGTLQVLGADGRLQQLELDRAAAGVESVPPQGPPFVAVRSESRDIEVGAFSKALPWQQGLLTVGDTGARFWKRPAH